MRRGEQAIFYHSNAKPPGVAGICQIVKEAEPDPTQFDPTSAYYDATSKPADPALGLGDGGAGAARFSFVPRDELRTIPELEELSPPREGTGCRSFPSADAEFDAIVRYARRRSTR